MRKAISIAILSMAFQTLASLYYALITLKVIHYDNSLNDIMQFLFLLSNVGLLIFFILLYENQSKNSTF